MLYYARPTRAAPLAARKAGSIDGVSDAGIRRGFRDRPAASRIASRRRLQRQPQPAPGTAGSCLQNHRSARSPSIRPRCRAVFTNRGGRLLHWRLKAYRDNRGEPVDLVPVGLPATEQLPFSLRVDRFESHREIEQRDLSRQRRCERTRRCDARRGIGVVRIPGCRRRLHVRKQFRFDPANYIVALSVSAAQRRPRDQSERRLGPGTRGRSPPRRRIQDSSTAARQPPPSSSFIALESGTRRDHEDQPSSRFRKGSSGSPASTITTS